jgi:hypothetical protein
MRSNQTQCAKPAKFRDNSYVSLRRIYLHYEATWNELLLIVSKEHVVGTLPIQNSVRRDKACHKFGQVCPSRMQMWTVQCNRLQGTERCNTNTGIRNTWRGKMAEQMMIWVKMDGSILKSKLEVEFRSNSWAYLEDYDDLRPQSSQNNHNLKYFGEKLMKIRNAYKICGRAGFGR